MVGIPRYFPHFRIISLNGGPSNYQGLTSSMRKPWLWGIWISRSTLLKGVKESPLRDKYAVVYNGETFPTGAQLRSECRLKDCKTP
jgi:hypothetical protein